MWRNREIRILLLAMGLIGVTATVAAAFFSSATVFFACIFSVLVLIPMDIKEQTLLLQGEDTVFFQGDLNWTAEALTNIFKNCVEHTPEGGKISITFIIDMLKMFNKSFRQTLIVITHDERIALQADRVLSIEDGRIAKDEVIRP